MTADDGAHWSEPLPVETNDDRGLDDDDEWTLAFGEFSSPIARPPPPPASLLLERLDEQSLLEDFPPVLFDRVPSPPLLLDPQAPPPLELPMRGESDVDRCLDEEDEDEDEEASFAPPPMRRPLSRWSFLSVRDGRESFGVEPQSFPMLLHV